MIRFSSRGPRERLDKNRDVARLRGFLGLLGSVELDLEKKSSELSVVAAAAAVARQSSQRSLLQSFNEASRNVAMSGTPRHATARRHPPVLVVLGPHSLGSPQRADAKSYRRFRQCLDPDNEGFESVIAAAAAVVLAALSSIHCSFA